MVSKGSAAWVIVIVSIIAFVIGAFMITVTDPIMQALFGSQLFSAVTADGQYALDWQVAVWGFIGMAILLAILVQIWIDTRQPT